MGKIIEICQGALFLSTVLLLITIIFMIIKRKTREYKELFHLMLACGVSVISYLCALSLENDLYKKAAMGVFLAFNTCICLMFLKFVQSITHTKERFGKFTNIMTIITIVDMISLIISSEMEHVISYDYMIFENRKILTLFPKELFYLHLDICYVLLISSAFLLIKGIVSNSKTFRAQYVIVGIVLFVIVLLNSAFAFSLVLLDYSVICYGIFAVILVYYTMYYLPHYLKDRMSHNVINHMNKGMVLFGKSGDMIMENKAAKKWIGEEITNLKDVCKGLKIDDLIEDIDYHKELNITHEGKLEIIDVNYSPIQEKVWNSGSVKVGSYIFIDNITQERKELYLREYKARHHEKTGLYNYEYFCEQVELLVRTNPKKDYVVIMTDIQQFNLFNEMFGRKKGDELLAKIGEMFNKSLTDKNITVGYYESDHFLICVPKGELEQQMYKKIKGIEQQLARYSFNICFYAGSCDIQKDDTPVSVYCDRALFAIKSSKLDMANCFAVYDQEMKEKMLNETMYAQSLPEAIKNKEIILYVQPQVNQMDGSMIGGEILVRWRGKDGELIPPGKFIPALENQGQITLMDQYVWEETTKLIKELMNQGLPTALSVNLSAQDLLKLDIYNEFSSLVKKYDVPQKYLKIEITESQIIKDVDKQVALINKLRKDGFIVEMDDFGSGYSSLNTLKDIPIDVLKLDMRFVSDTEKSIRSKKIVEGIVRLAKDIDIAIIVEGVENEGQAEFLRSVDCKYIQGYLFGRPIPIDEFIELRKNTRYQDTM